MTTPKPQSPFNWQGQPSQLLDKWGKLKSQREMLLDANRTNPTSSVGYSITQTNSYKAPR